MRRCALVETQREQMTIEQSSGIIVIPEPSVEIIDSLKNPFSSSGIIVVIIIILLLVLVLVVIIINIIIIVVVVVVVG